MIPGIHRRLESIPLEETEVEIWPQNEKRSLPMNHNPVRPKRKRRWPYVAACATLACFGLYRGVDVIALQMPQLRPTMTTQEHFRESWRNVKLARAPEVQLPPNWPAQPPNYPLATKAQIPTIDPRKVCVMSADTREFQPYLRPNSYHTPSTNHSNPTTHDFASGTALYNMWWAMRHGYRYLRTTKLPPKGYHHTWSKIPGLLQAIDECEWTIFFDGDAIVMEPSITIEDMLSEFGFKEGINFAWSEESHKYHGRVNTGFGIFRSTPVTKKMLLDVLHCPDEVEGCDRFIDSRADEQDAFSVYISKGLARGKDWLGIDCYFVNGWWDTEVDGKYPEYAADQYCRGVMVAHHYLNKQEIMQKAVDIIASETFAWLNTQWNGIESRPAFP